MCTFATAGMQTKPPAHKEMTADYYVIKTARFNAGLTQKELAERAKISLSVVIKAERCDHNRKKVTGICGKRIDFLHMIRNAKLMSEIPTMKPLADKNAAAEATEE